MVSITCCPIQKMAIEFENKITVFHIVVILPIAFGLWFFLHTGNEFYETEVFNMNQDQITFHASGGIGWNGFHWNINLEGKFATGNDTELAEYDDEDYLQPVLNEVAYLHRIHLGYNRFYFYETTKALSKYLREYMLLSIAVEWDRNELDSQFSRSEMDGDSYFENFRKPTRKSRSLWYGDFEKEQIPSLETGEFQYKKSFYLTTFNNSLFSSDVPYRNLTVIPRIKRRDPPTSWFSWLTLSYWFDETPPSPSRKSGCIWLDHPIEKSEINNVPEARITILFCCGA